MHFLCDRFSGSAFLIDYRWIGENYLTKQPVSYTCNYLPSPAAESRPADYMFCFCFYLFILFFSRFIVGPTISKCIGPVFAEISGLVELRGLFTISLEWYIWSLKERCRGNHILYTRVAGRRRLVAQPGGLTLGFVLHPVEQYHDYWRSVSLWIRRHSQYLVQTVWTEMYTSKEQNTQNSPQHLPRQRCVS